MNRQEHPLRRWCREKRGRAKWLAMDCGVRPSYISMLRNGLGKPSKALRQLIELHTEGQVPRDCWEAA